MNTIDWSATAAWTALIISVVGSIIGPIISALVTNKHQLKMYNLSFQQNQLSEYNKDRKTVLEDFVSNIGKCIANCTYENQSAFGAAYFAAYQYIPDTYWDQLDALYDDICNSNLDEAMSKYRKIIHVVAGLLKEPLQ